MSDMYVKSPLEKLNFNVCKYLLGVTKWLLILLFVENFVDSLYRHCYGHD